jgi:Putative DNA-binding domain
MTALSALQSDFAAELGAAADLRAPACLSARDAERFRVYRNNVWHGLSAALGEAYPVVKRLVGDGLFAAMARAFLARGLPQRRSLALFGAGFAEFIDGFEAVSGLPYLADVARLERAVLEAMHATDAPVLSPAEVAALGDNILQTRAVLHPATRLVLAAHPVTEIWLAHQQTTVTPMTLVAGASAALVTRPHLSPLVQRLEEPDAAFLQGLMQGRSLGEACIVADGLDATAGFTRLLVAGALRSLELAGDDG